MSSFLEIGEIVEAIPNPIKVISSAEPVTLIPSQPNGKSSSNFLGWTILIGLAIGGAIIYYNTIKDENTNISNKP